MIDILTSMYEIELKAHAAEADAVRRCLATFARPVEMIDKSDTYYRLELHDSHFDRLNDPDNELLANHGKTSTNGKPYLTARIREEVHHTNSGDERSILFTYKRKRLVSDGAGAAIEVNDENECTISDSGALQAMLFDAGFVVSHKKHKKAEGYMADTPCGEAHIELCAVPPLGDFLEIEILSEKNDDQTIAAAHQAIKEIFTRCCIPLEAIEERYYTQMLEEVASQQS